MGDRTVPDRETIRKEYEREGEATSVGAQYRARGSPLAEALAGVFRARMRAALSLLPRIEAKRVLDIGSGSGIYTLAAARAGADVVSLDISRSYLRKARTLVAEGGYPFSGVAGDGIRLPFRDRAFDVAIALEVLEHVTEPEAVLAELSRILGPHSVLLLSYPQALSPLEVASRMLDRGRRLVGRGGSGGGGPLFHQHLHYFTEPRLSAALRPAGFRLLASARACVLHPLLLPVLAAIRDPERAQCSIDRRFARGLLGSLAWCTVLRYERRDE